MTLSRLGLFGPPPACGPSRYALMSHLCTCAHTHAYIQKDIAIQSGSVLTMIKDIRCPAASSTSLRILELNQFGALYGRFVFCTKGKPWAGGSGPVTQTETHTHTVMQRSRHVHKRTHTCTHLSTRESHSHAGLVFWAQATLLLLLSFPASLLTSVSSRGFSFCVSRRVVYFSVSICLFTCLGFWMSFALFLFLPLSVCLPTIFPLM